MTSWKTGCSGTTSANELTSHPPTAGVSSLGLKTTALPGRQRVGDRPHRGEDRVVPRADDADHAERLVLQRGRLVDGDQAAADPARAEHLARVLGRPVDVHDRQQDLQLGVGQRLAGLGVHELGQPADVPGQVRLPGEQPLLAAVPAEAGPPLRGRLGPRDGRRPRPASLKTGKVAMTSDVAGFSVSKVSADLDEPESCRAWLS